MARSTTLATLRTRVRYLADIEGEVRRHPNARLLELINDSIQAYRDLLTSVMPDSAFRVRATVATTTSGTASYSVPSGSASISGVELVSSNSDRVDLPYLHPRDVAQFDVTETGEPRFWSFLDSGKVTLVPTPDGTYSYYVWYDPTATNLASDSDTWDSIVEGGVEWVVLHVSADVRLRDDDDERHGKLMQRLAVQTQLVQGNALRYVRNSTHYRRDTRSERLSSGRRQRRLAT